MCSEKSKRTNRARGNGRKQNTVGRGYGILSKFRKRFAKEPEQPGTAPVSAAPQKTRGIPNSVLNDVFAGERRAADEMPGRNDPVPPIAVKMSQPLSRGRGLLRSNPVLEHQADNEGLLSPQKQTVYGGNMGTRTILGEAGFEGITPAGTGLNATTSAPMQATDEKDDDTPQKQSDEDKAQQ